MTCNELYADLIRRHLKRDPKRSDGFPESTLADCEKRLGVKLPAAMREYYRIAGRLDEINKSHNLLFAPDELKIEEAYLWFMEENQAVVHWGLPLKKLSDDNPIVYQRVNDAEAKWYSEKQHFATFLIRMFDWQAGFADAPE